MGVGLYGHHAQVSMHVYYSVYVCAWVWPPTRGLLSFGMCEHMGVPALMGAGLSYGRDTGEEKRLGCVLRALTNRAGSVSCTMLMLQCVAISDTGQQIWGEREGQVNLHRQIWMGQESLKRNTCAYNKRGQKHTMEKAFVQVHTHAHTHSLDSTEVQIPVPTQTGIQCTAWAALSEETYQHFRQILRHTCASHVTCWGQCTCIYKPN